MLLVAKSATEDASVGWWFEVHMAAENEASEFETEVHCKETETETKTETDPKTQSPLRYLENPQNFQLFIWLYQTRIYLYLPIQTPGKQ